MKPRPARFTCFAQKFIPSVGPFDASVRWWFRISPHMETRATHGADSPDGYIAWVGDGTDTGLRDAPTTWFGAP